MPCVPKDVVKNIWIICNLYFWKKCLVRIHHLQLQRYILTHSDQISILTPSISKTLPLIHHTPFIHTILVFLHSWKRRSDVKFCTIRFSLQFMIKSYQQRWNSWPFSEWYIKCEIWIGKLYNIYLNWNIVNLFNYLTLT